jgi:hypothetical protein
MFCINTKEVCSNLYHKRGRLSSMGIHPRGNRDGEEMSPASIRGDPHIIFFGRGAGDGELKPDGKFSIAIPTYMRR